MNLQNINSRNLKGAFETIYNANYNTLQETIAKLEGRLERKEGEDDSSLLERKNRFQEYVSLLEIIIDLSIN